MTIGDLRNEITSATSIIIRFCDSKADALNDKYYKSIYVNKFPGSEKEKYDDLAVKGIYPLRKDVLEAYVVIKKEDNKFYNEKEADTDDVIENILRGKSIRESIANA